MTYQLGYHHKTSFDFLDILPEFGPICNSWEGGGRSKKIIKLIKPLFNGVQKYWQVNVLDKMLMQMAIERVHNSVLKESGDRKKKQSSSSKLCFTYSAFQHLEQQYNDRKQISIVQVDNEKFLAKISNERNVEISGDYASTMAGAHNHHWSLPNTQPKSMSEANMIMKYIYNFKSKLNLTLKFSGEVRPKECEETLSP